jgi:tetratricopeptide (TPR) repeat protein
MKNNYSLEFELLRARAPRETENVVLFQQLLYLTELLEKHGEVIDLYKEILNNRPYSGLVWYNLGMAYQELGSVAEALDALEFAYITRPGFDAAYRDYAELAIQEKRYRSAFYCYQEMCANVETDGEVLLHMAYCQRALKDIVAAKDLITESLRLNPYEAAAYYQLGCCCMDEHDYQSASKWLREAVRRDAERDDFHGTLANVFSHLQQYGDAENHYWLAIEQAPYEKHHWEGLAKMQLHCQRTAEAEEVLGQAIENVGHTDFVYGRAACLFLLGHNRAASTTLRAALRMAFDQHTVLFDWAPDLQSNARVRRLIEKNKSK